MWVIGAAERRPESPILPAGPGTWLGSLLRLLAEPFLRFVLFSGLLNRRSDEASITGVD